MRCETILSQSHVTVICRLLFSQCKTRFIYIIICILYVIIRRLRMFADFRLTVIPSGPLLDMTGERVEAGTHQMVFHEVIP